MAIESYDEPHDGVPTNHSCLFNAMIYPFTRMVIYGSLWYQGNIKEFVYIKIVFNLDCNHIGESNAGNPSYACKFAKMIEYWREIWNERTNGSTDIQFPFGFVQVSFILSHAENFVPS